ncbi:MAG: hypothetical protein KatS3mg068_0323 [Candidatus Sericytochromatia bacterium]|nr:MAG: hypothetical protein KatS3mg068_0323 [Candidatus Sericytochromatia bacterium]
MSNLGINRYNFNNINTDSLNNVNSKKTNLDKSIDSNNNTINSNLILNLENKLNFSVKNSKLADLKTSINFLSNDKKDSLKIEQKDTIKNSVDLNKLNENVNNKIADDILKQAYDMLKQNPIIK